MGKIWETSLGYSLTKKYVDACTRTSFSKVTIEGTENLPQDGAVVLAPNHSAALMDAMMVLLVKKDSIAFGARYDIFKNAKVASVLNWLRILPLARERDGLAAVATNDKVFDEIVECLDHGVPFGIFSEGTHRAQRGMLPVKKGIFRVARRAAERLGKPVYVVPVGLDYEYYFHQGGSACIRIGEPINVTQYFKDHEGELDAVIYRGLCNELQRRDEALIGHYGTDGVHEKDVTAEERWKPARVLKLILMWIAAIILLPVFVACCIISFPVWLTAELILLKMKDKSWTHTVYFAVRIFLPIFWPFFQAYAFLLNGYRKLIHRT